MDSDALALEDRRERLAGHELHDEEGAAVLLAVVEDVGDALVVDERGVAGLGAEALEEARVAHVLVLEDLDGDGAADDVVGRLPHLAHAADGDPRLQLVAAAEGHTLRRSHLSSTASMTFFAIGAAMHVAAPRLALSAAVLHDDRDCDLRVVRRGEPGEPQRVRLILAVLRGAGLTGHVDPVYSCITAGAVRRRSRPSSRPSSPPSPR